MKIDEEKFIEILNNKDYKSLEINLDKIPAKKKLNENLEKLLYFINTNIKNNNVAQASLDIKSDNIQIMLQIGIINLPFANSRSINKIFAGDKDLPLNVYMIIASPYINKSLLRIDELTTANNFIKSDGSQYLNVFKEWVENNLKKIKENKKLKN